MRNRAVDTWNGPYLSVVVVTRNDDHGGDPLGRLQAFVNTFDMQCRRTGLDAELVVVEWNPPADRARLESLLRRPEECRLTLRFVEVPPELHQRLQHAEVLPLFQMIAKNVGIRRARGRFILATNIDIIFSNELVEFISSARLDPRFLYRVDRHDIESAFPIDAPLDTKMAYCTEHQLRLHQRSGTQVVDSRGRIIAQDQDIVGPPVVTLGDGWHVREGDTTWGFYRWACDVAQLHIDRTRAPGLSRDAILDLEIEPNPYQPDSWVELEILDGGRPLARQRVSQMTSLHVALDDDVSDHVIVLKLLEASTGGRQSLTIFERRDTLQYRVRSARVRTLPLLSAAHDYELDQWRRANSSREMTVGQTQAGVTITTEARDSSYCVKYGPLEAPTDGTYEFVLQYSCFQGGLALCVLDDLRNRWLRSEMVVNIHKSEQRIMVVSCELQRGQTFSLYVTNDNRPCRDGVSRFVLHSLRGSARPNDLRPRSTWVVSFVHWLAGRVDRVLRACVSGVRRVWRGLAIVVDKVGAKLGESEPHSQEVHEAGTQASPPAAFSELAGVGRFLKDHRPSLLHQNACGDFQLMAREQWHALRGYPEFNMYSMNIDGLFTSIAHGAGIKEQMLDMPLCIYHLEHEKGSGWTPEGEELLRRRIAKSGITWLENEVVHILGTYMEWLGRPMIFNGSDWGLGDVVLPETTLQTVADHA
jgi:hypothetical protein